MAVAFVANRASVQNATVGLGNLLPMTTGGSISIGSTLLLYAAYDEAASTQQGGAAISSVQDYLIGRNYWQRVSRVLNDPVGTDAGVVVEIWACYVAKSYTNSSQISVAFNESITRGVFLIKEFSGVAPTYANGSGGNLVGPVYGNSVVSNTATGNGTTIGSLTVTPPAAGWLVVGVAGIETNTAITGDADVTDGTWSAIGTTLSNSGADATSVTLSEQYKIVTGTSAQNWAVTKTGAADWATALVGLPFYSPVAPARPAGNPNYPCIAGYEGLPTEELVVPLDTGTGYLYTTPYIYPNAQNTDSLTAATALKNVKDGLSQHTLAWDLYNANAMVAQDEIITVAVPVAAATSTGTVSAPAVTILDAITEIGNGYLRLDAGEVVNFRIDGAAFSAAYTNYRIVNLGIRYIAWRNDTPYSDNSAPSVGFKMTWKDVRNGATATPTAYDYGYWLVPNYRSTMGFETRQLGETNFIPQNTNSGPYSGRSARNFTMRDMFEQNVGSGTSFTIECVTGSDTAQNVIFFDYIELVFEMVPERRYANANTLVSSIPYVYDTVETVRGIGPYGFGDNITGAFYDIAAGAAGIEYPNFVLPTVSTTNPLLFTVREALPADGSDFFRALVVNPNDPGNTEAKFTGAEAVGTPLQMQALSNTRATQSPYPTMFLGTFVDGLILDADNSPLIEEYIPASSIYPRTLGVSDGYIWPQFNILGVPNEVKIANGAVSATQTQYVQVPGGQQYSHLKLLVKSDPTVPTATTLNVSVQQPLATPLATASITKLAMDTNWEDVGNGWREITLVLSAPITPAAGQVALVFSSTATGLQASSFYLQGSYPKTLDSGYNNAAANDDTRPTDSSAVLMCPIPAPALTLDSVTQTMLPLFPSFTGCLTGSYQHPRIAVTNGGSYGAVTIERSSDGGVTWDLAALYDNPTNATVLVDQEVPWDIQILYPISYRVRGYRDADRNFAETITSAWAGTSTAPGQVIGLASNDSGYEFWFTPVSEGSLEVQWTPLSPVNFTQLHGKDYSYAMREAEDRGFELTVPIVVNQTSFCQTTGSGYIANVTPYGEALGKGARSFSPRVFEATVLPIIRSSARWKLRLPGGHSRTVSVDTTGFTTITAAGLYLAELKITDVVEPDPSPYCEGL